MFGDFSHQQNTAETPELQWTRGLDAHCVEREMAAKRVWNPTTTGEFRDGFFHVFYRFFSQRLEAKSGGETRSRQ